FAIYFERSKSLLLCTMLPIGRSCCYTFTSLCSLLGQFLSGILYSQSAWRNLSISGVFFVIGQKSSLGWPHQRRKAPRRCYSSFQASTRSFQRCNPYNRWQGRKGIRFRILERICPQFESGRLYKFCWLS